MEQPKTKTMAVYAVREFQRQGSQKKEESWTLIGSCFPNQKDEGFTIRLNALPLDGRLVVRPPKKESAQDAA
jgi:hypothetical protein